jgi:hypothetical protein
LLLLLLACRMQEPDEAGDASVGLLLYQSKSLVNVTAAAAAGAAGVGLQDAGA